MILFRVIDKNTKLFIRDDFTFNGETEIGLEVKPSQGLYKPKWNGTEWVEGLSEEEVNKLKKSHPIETSLEERLEQTEQLLQATTMAFTEFIFSQTT